MKKIVIGLICGLSILVSSMLQAAEQDVQRYIEVFSGSTSWLQLEALNQLQWSGLSDTRVFDLVEKNLVATYPNAVSKEALDLVSWYAKSLGTSGLDKYQGTLQKIADSDSHKKIRKYAREGLDNLKKYKVWNPIIANQDNINPDKPESINGFANMLRSSDWSLRNIAAKRMLADNILDEYLLNVLDGALKKEYQNDYTDKLRVMTIALMTKAMAASGNAKYKPTVIEVANSAGSKKVRKYANKYLRQYY